MARTLAQKQADNTARQAAAANAEATMTTLLTNLQTYLAAGSGDRKAARVAVRDWVLWKLSSLGVTESPGYPHRELSDIDFETAGEPASDY